MLLPCLGLRWGMLFEMLTQLCSKEAAVLMPRPRYYLQMAAVTYQYMNGERLVQKVGMF